MGICQALPKKRMKLGKKAHKKSVVAKKRTEKDTENLDARG